MRIHTYDQPPARRFKKRPLIIVGLVILGFLTVGLVVALKSNDRQVGSIPDASIAKKKAEQTRQLAILNSVDATDLSPLQTKILKLIKQEFAKSPESYNSTVLKYTEGFEESWCADFVSWIMNQAGSPNINPETGYWRIPGVFSMINYYKSIDGYVSKDEAHIPRLGDVAFYIGEVTPDGSSGEHIAFVLSFDGKKLVTIGGNEGDGVMRVRSESLETNIEKGLIGYGILE
jgi:hypothetical protein